CCTDAGWTDRAVETTGGDARIFAERFWSFTERPLDGLVLGRRRGSDDERAIRDRAAGLELGRIGAHRGDAVFDHEPRLLTELGPASDGAYQCTNQRGDFEAHQNSRLAPKRASGG